GSSRIPLVTQLLSADLNRPVAIDTDPTTAIALGAAQLARPTPAVAPAGISGKPPAVDPPPPTEQPEPPSLTAIPLHVTPAELPWRRARSRRVRQMALAGVLALMTAVGVALVPFLTARSDASPPASSGTSPSNAPAAPETGTPSDDAASP